MAYSFHHISRHYAKVSRKVAGAIPDKVIGFLNLPTPSSRTMALGSTQPLTELSTRNFPGGVKGGRRVKDNNLRAICVSNIYIWSHNIAC
jgi:hypothetical protein